MEFIKANITDSSISAEVSISLVELLILETALSKLSRTLNKDKDFFERNFELDYLLSDVQKTVRECEKLQPQQSPKNELKKLVAKFRKWLTDNYTNEQIRADLTDDAGYPFWTDIENHFREILKSNLLSSLDREDKINLLYLISRNWNIGSMIGWLSVENPQTGCGAINDADFMELAQIVSELDSSEFDDAKVQFAFSLQKFGELNSEIEEILLRIYETSDEYSKRTALNSLATLGYPETKILVQKSWETEDSELHKMNCLELIKEKLNDKIMLKEYLNKASHDKRPEISELVKKLKTEIE